MSQLVAHIGHEPKTPSSQHKRGKREALAPSRCDRPAVPLVHAAPHTYLDYITQHLGGVKPGVPISLVLPAGVREAWDEKPVLSDKRGKARSLDGVCLECSAKSVVAFQQLQNRGTGRTAGPATMKELELY